MSNQFGLLSAVKKVASNNGAIWKFRCKCGNIVIRKITDVRRSSKNGFITSCGCFSRGIEFNPSNSQLSKILSRIKTRCNNSKVDSYKNYGGRGIKVCDDWMKSSDKFREWALRNGYKKGKSIERKNVNLGYCPENCEWIDLEDQVKNKRNSRRITYKEKTLTPREWSDELNMPFNALQLRITRKWSIERIFSQPFRKKL